jgi:hypothetical protein
MRPIVKSVRYDPQNRPLEVAPWSAAKEELTNELGSFCSYCGKYNSRSALHVEHIYGRKCADETGNLKYEHLQYRWDNFLLACVNCNSIKRHTVPATDLDTIIDLAGTTGYFAIWYTTFHAFEEVREALIKRAFPGTHQQSFDQKNN